jgi:hypothetical protein
LLLFGRFGQVYRFDVEFSLTPGVLVERSGREHGAAGENTQLQRRSSIIIVIIVIIISMFSGRSIGFLQKRLPELLSVDGPW